MRAMLGLVALLLSGPVSGQAPPSAASSGGTSAVSQTGGTVSGTMPDQAVINPVSCDDSTISVASSALTALNVASPDGIAAAVCPIVENVMPLFAKRDRTAVAPVIPYVEDDTKFYVPLVTTAAVGKGQQFFVPFKATSMVVDDFYSIGGNGHRPKLGLALDYIKANGGSVLVAPTTISDAKNGNHSPWLAAIVKWIVHGIRGNSMKGLKQYDVIFFVAPGANLYETKIDHVCFNARGSGIVDCLDAAEKWRSKHA